ncbi:hypothetical protein GmHk_02G005052 [Glycine max]|nr:hypothetical protein GmHk_02G005052 [Glycine max]
MWYHDHLGKLGSKCRGHLVVHRQLPHGDQPESQGSSKPRDMPSSTSIPPHEKLQVLTDKVYTISMQYEV